jgi:replication factor C small subunit
MGRGESRPVTPGAGGSSPAHSTVQLGTSGRSVRNPISMEDFRPTSLDEIVGQDEVIKRLKKLVAGVAVGSIVPPNLLMYGPPGVGKTTAARAFARDVLGKDWENSFHQLDASDDRSVSFVQNKIVPLALRPPSRRAPFRIFFFDEAEALSPEVQSVLRPAMESRSGRCVFILACNRPAHISDPVQSRCITLEFKFLTPTEIRRVVAEALGRLDQRVDESVLESIAQRARGIPREALKLLIEEHESQRETSAATLSAEASAK